MAGSLVSSYFDWWKDNAHSFHFVREGVFSDYSLGLDKVGHAYTSYFYFHAFHNVMLWGGFEEDEAMWWAFGASAFFAVSVEVGDGLSRHGFSFEDLGFNLAGLGLGFAQVHVPYLRHFQFKWSYVPRGGYRWPPRFTDHYDAHTYWLTVSIHGLFPNGLLSWWPPFLNLALGYGANENLTRREFVVGLDLHLGAFEVGSRDLRLMQRIVSMVHLPGPALKFTEGRSPQALPVHLR